LKIVLLERNKLNLTGNNFTNCYNSNSFVGALLLEDYSYIEKGQQFIINNNTFSNNFGLLTGAIFL
jgi:hypothetical protein